jgi:Protein of unknown function (DUF2585)
MSRISELAQTLWAGDVGLPRRRLAMRGWHVVIVALILAAQALLLSAMGRLAICKCGFVKIWHGARVGSENSQHLFDWWSLSHAVHGFLFYGGFWLVARKAKPATRLIAAVCLEVSWELFENSNFIIERYRDAGALDYFGDTVVNSVADVFAMMLGFSLATRLPLWASVAVVLMLELSAGFAIRDNLTLNVIMLTHPVDAIRVWQQGG